MKYQLPGVSGPRLGGTYITMGSRLVVFDLACIKYFTCGTRVIGQPIHNGNTFINDTPTPSADITNTINHTLLPKSTISKSRNTTMNRLTVVLAYLVAVRGELKRLKGFLKN